ncbi:Gustatory receptor 3 [Ladona fulva]|uniref:Gustatory receptor n=1 Tax=Ladona fulva TaxID=123851 RepID=A0A8K0KGM7_LADFU|nr:Gustatory receptor 3 [Ladona fulva]
MIPIWLRTPRIGSDARLSTFGSNSKDENVSIFESKAEPPKIRRRRRRTYTKRGRIGAYYDTMEYILKALRFVACLPISVDRKNGTVEFRIRSFSFVFTVLAYGAWSVLVWVVVAERLQILEDSSHSFDDSVVAYVFVIYFLEWPLLPFIRWFWQTPRLISFVAKWRNFEDQYRRVTGAPLVIDEETSRIVVATVVVSIPVISLLVAVASHYVVPLINSLHLAAYWVIATQMYLNSAFVWATSRALQAAAMGLVRGLQRDMEIAAKNATEMDRGTRRWPQDYMAGSDIRDELSLIMVKPKTSLKIQEFLQLMEATRPYITVGGYFNLDKGFVSQLLGTMVTYLVVLLQFRHAMHAPTISWQHYSPMSTEPTINEMSTISGTATSKV